MKRQKSTSFRRSYSILPITTLPRTRCSRERSHICSNWATKPRSYQSAVIDGIDVVYVLHIVSRNVLHTNFVVGTRMPAYCTAPGLAILARLPQGEAEDILGRSNLVRHTPHTVTDVRAIKRRLALIRERGYAHTAEEYVLGDISTAAAITDSSGRAVSAVSVAVSKSRWADAGHERRYADLVISTASAIAAPRQ